MEEWHRCVKTALRQGEETRGRYGQTERLLALRKLVSSFAGFSRGVRCREQDVLIRNGAQQALDLLARVLFEPGSTMVVEEPGYPPDH
jgi:GntR family transcriptional regulator/MocR family aminotransferase